MFPFQTPTLAVEVLQGLEATAGEAQLERILVTASPQTMEVLALLSTGGVVVAGLAAYATAHQTAPEVAAQAQ